MDFVSALQSKLRAQLGFGSDFYHKMHHCQWTLTCWWLGPSVLTATPSGSTLQLQGQSGLQGTLLGRRRKGDHLKGWPSDSEVLSPVGMPRILRLCKKLEGQPMPSQTERRGKIPLWKRKRYSLRTEGRMSSGTNTQIQMWKQCGYLVQACGQNSQDFHAYMTNSDCSLMSWQSWSLQSSA